MTPPLLELRGVRKRFGKVEALAGAELTALPGEIHAILGENGAGKSTLMGVLDGLIRPDGGEMRLRGVPFAPRSPREAGEAGIGLVHQHFALVPRFSVLENVLLGLRSGGPGLGWPVARVRARLHAIAAQTGLDIDPDAPVETLPVGARQRVEILKALLHDPAVLALDEPTAVLAPAEIDRLFALLRELAAKGRTILLIAHKLDEVLAVAHRFTVLRDGRTVLEAGRSEVDAERLAHAMVGRELPPPSGAPPGPGISDGADAAGGAGGAAPIAILRNASAASSAGGHSMLHPVSLTAHRGEIVGIAGVDGNGQRELALLLAGRVRARSGSVDLPPRVGFIPQDRRSEGLVLSLSLTENVALALHDVPEWRRGPFLRWRAIREETRALIRRHGVRAPGPGTPAEALSGGNQQKVVVGRELDREPDLLIVENPTRGLDVGAALRVHELLREARPGRAMVLISTDLDEVLALSDRILVMVRGRLIPVPEDQRTREGVGARMLTGATAGVAG